MNHRLSSNELSFIKHINSNQKKSSIPNKKESRDRHCRVAQRSNVKRQLTESQCIHLHRIDPSSVEFNEDRKHGRGRGMGRGRVINKADRHQRGLTYSFLEKKAMERISKKPPRFMVRFILSESESVVQKKIKKDRFRVGSIQSNGRQSKESQINWFNPEEYLDYMATCKLLGSIDSIMFMSLRLILTPSQSIKSMEIKN
jgi:hypothetical protein